ncbi:MAG: cytochrome C [Cyanobacteria bacterium K_DeepCast_35m_m1_288]|nr:cytochrome C [Cyanobacteria bacterium K_DeepCast_35m_m1_288]
MPGASRCVRGCRVPQPALDHASGPQVWGRAWTSLKAGLQPLVLSAILLGLAFGAGPAAQAAPMPAPIAADASLSQLAQNRPLVSLGKAIFEDENLSLRRNMSCATCHAISAGGTAGSDLGNRLAGVHQGSAFQGFALEPSADNAMGFRNVQTSAYAAFSPPLKRLHQGDAVVFEGGNFWDGRATGFMTGRAGQEQATQPAIGTLEGQLPAPACVVYRVLHPARRGQYPVSYQSVFGSRIDRIRWPEDIETQCSSVKGTVQLEGQARHFSSDTQIQIAYSNISLALMAYEGSAAMSPFSSRYDGFLQGKAVLTASEKRGLSLFSGKAKCASCHVTQANSRGLKPLFTDYTYDNLGVPRNPANPIYRSTWINNQGRQWQDLGLGGFLLTQDSYREDAPDQMGKFKVPTVRNVARTPDPQFVRAYMHNGYFKTLEQVVDFYNSRDSKPRCASPWTPVEEAERQGCWPEPEYPQTMNTTELGNLQLTAAEQGDLVAFLRTLSDRQR